MRHIRLLVSFLLLLTSGITAVCQQPAAIAANATVPPLVKFSGVLTDGSGKPLAGTVGVTFALYKDEQGGSPLWLETQSVQPDKSGHYSVMLGTTTSQGLPGGLFISGEARWVGVQAQGQPEQPRVLLSSVPYAMKAQDAQTIGGLPPSAFVLAAPTGNAASSASPPSSSDVTTTGGTVNTLPLWTTATNIQSSAITQTGSGKTAKIGINNSKPASTLDVKGNGTIRGLFSLPAAGTATSAAGFNSQPMDLAASAFNSGTSTAVSQTFQWQAEPVGNDTSNASGSLNLLFGQGTSKPTETGLNVASNGQITFASGQAFPGTGTVTSVGSGAGLTGGPITGSGTLSIANGGVSNSMLANPSLTVTAGTDLTGGGSVPLGGTTTLNLDTTKVPQLGTANTFSGNQTVNGNLSATGMVSGGGFQIASTLFAFGSYNNSNAFLGFAGNTTTTGTSNTASGYQALVSETTGYLNTADGAFALSNNTTGEENTATGESALGSNTTGEENTASGFEALSSNTVGRFNTAEGAFALENNTTGINNAACGLAALLGNSIGSYNTASGNYAGSTGDATYVTGSDNTFVGYESAMSTGSLNNATAIGANAEVAASNSLVLGSIKGVNNATANTNVGIGTTSPAYSLDVHGTGNFTGNITFASTQTFPGTGTITGVAAGTDLTGGGNSGNVTLNVDTTKIVTGVVAGTDLTGGGTGGVQTLNLDTTKVPQLGTANTYTGNQTVNGNLSTNGVVNTGTAFDIAGAQIVSTLPGLYNLYVGQFAGQGAGGNNTGSYNTSAGYQNLFLNTTGSDNTASGFEALYANTTGSENTASGYGALYRNTIGSQNTASGGGALVNNTTGGGNTAAGLNALFSNTTGSNNTASGDGTLYSNTIGSENTASGFLSGGSVDSSPITGSYNTFIGANSVLSTGALNNTTAIGARAEVDASNAMVLGSINGVNGCNPSGTPPCQSTNVGIGITSPTYLLHIGNQGGANYNNFLRVEGPTQSGANGWATSFGGNGNFGIDAPGTPGGRFYVLENGMVGIGCGPSNPCTQDILAIGLGQGQPLADGWATYSSRRWKTNVHQLQGALSKVQQLRGVSYDLKQSGKHEIGVIAEEVGRVVPEIVSYEKNAKDAQGVDYSRLTALLIEAVKEQQREIASQLAQIRKLRDKDTRQTRVLQNLAAQMTILQSKLAQLDGKLGGTRQAKTASAGTTNGQTVVAKAQF